MTGKDYQPPKDRSNDYTIRLKMGSTTNTGTTPWGDFGPKHCPPGTWSNTTKLETNDQCTSCPRGWKCTFSTNQIGHIKLTRYLRYLIEIPSLCQNLLYDLYLTIDISKTWGTLMVFMTSTWGYRILSTTTISMANIFFGLVR